MVLPPPPLDPPPCGLQAASRPAVAIAPVAAAFFKNDVF